MGCNKKVFEFSAALRGCHNCRRFWISQKDQILECFFETHNPFDRVAIKVCEVGNENSVGHFSREISHVTKFFMDKGAIVSAQLTREHYRRSPIVQSGIEIARKVTVKMPGTCGNILLMEKYKQLVPKNEEIVGSFLQANETIDGVRAQPVSEKVKVKRKQTNKAVHRQKDIRHFF